LDFHPSNGELLCSCDDNSEIRYWSVNQGTCKKVSKGGRGQLRFQPQLGQLIAATAENGVVIFDVETDTHIYSLQKHIKPVHSLCWNATGEYVASVSEDSVKISAVQSGGRCIQEVNCTGNPFQTCVFHPHHQSLLIIGCNQTFELWNMAENKTMSLKSPEALITALAQSPATGMVASASHDKCVKLWK
jgi:WD40 repeat protein